MDVVFICSNKLRPDGTRSVDERRVRVKTTPMVNCWGDLIDVFASPQRLARMQVKLPDGKTPPMLQWVTPDGEVWGAFRIEP